MQIKTLQSIYETEKKKCFNDIIQWEHKNHEERNSLLAQITKTVSFKIILFTILYSINVAIKYGASCFKKLIEYFLHTTSVGLKIAL